MNHFKTLLLTGFCCLLSIHFVFAQLSTQRLPSSLNFLEGTTTKASLSYNGLDLTLKNEEVGGALLLDAQNFFRVHTLDTARMMILSNGNTGIGTNFPSDRLHVANGNLRIDNRIPLLRFSDGAIEHAFIGVLTKDIIIRNYNDIGNLEGRILYEAANSHSFSTGDPLRTRVIIGSNGNMGIGTADPGNYRLVITHDTYGLLLEQSSNQNDWEIVSEAADLALYNEDNIKGRFSQATGAYTALSDKRYKNNIKNLSKVLPSVMQLDAKTYHYKADQSKRQDIGFLAQEVESIFPEMVYKGENREKKGEDIYSLNYGGFSVIAIKAIQELKIELDEKEKKIESLEARLTRLEALLGNSIETPIQNTQLSSAKLGQNSPNPFNGKTNISYFIPTGTTTALVRITDQTGKVLKEINVSQIGAGQLELDANTLNSGQYFYSLILDGKIFETKQMVLSK